MQVEADTTFTPQLAVASPLVNFGARIEVPITREIVSYWRQAALEGGVWTIHDMETPIEVGEFLLVWRTGDPEPPDYEVFIPLTVVTAEVAAASGVDYPDLSDEIEYIRPSIEEISILENTRTAAGGGGEVGEFNENTRPSADEVELLIDQAVGAVLAQLPTSSPPEFYDRIKHAIALYTATLIEASFFREELDGGSVELWRTLFNNAILNLQRSIDAELRQGAAFGATMLH